MTPKLIKPSEKFTSEVSDNRLRLRKFRKDDEQSLKALQSKLVAVEMLISYANFVNRIAKQAKETLTFERTLPKRRKRPKPSGRKCLRSIPNWPRTS